MRQNKLLLLDAYALIYRAFYAMIRNPRVTTTGIDTSAVFGFVNTLQELLKREQPTHIAVCFDPGGKTFRHDQYQPYKANREKTPEAILVAVPYIKRILEAYHIPTFQVDGYEADDVIGSLSRLAQQRDFFTYIVTGDKDLGQLVTDQVKILNPAKHEVLGVAEVNAKYGIRTPLQLIDILGLMGDSADNIPGCPGVGPKTAQKLIQQFGSIENLLAHTDQLKGVLKDKVTANDEQIRMSKWLATIKTDLPITFNEQDLLRQPADLEQLRVVFTELQFRTLTTRLIDQREANVGLSLDDSKHQSTPQLGINPSTASFSVLSAKDKSVKQLSLFDLEAEDLAEPSQPTSLKDVTYSYKRLTHVADVTQAVESLKQCRRVAITIVAMGEEAMRASLMGIAVCGEVHHAFYVPCDDSVQHSSSVELLQALAPLFASEVCIVCSDVKRAMVMLANRGITFSAPYYDTAVAHYLLQPERTHTTSQMARELLNYDCVDQESILGAKGRGQLALQQISSDRFTQWCCELADLTLQLPDVINQQLQQEGMSHLLNDIEMPLVRVLASMELAGARIDVQALNDYANVLAQQIQQLDSECQQLAGVAFNTASPMQVGEILFDRLKIDQKAKKTKTGQFSTTEDILMRLRDRHPIVDKILQLRAKRKLLNTYVSTLPSLINPHTGRIHTTFNQTVTATGRLSSANPNLQNIPVRSEQGREIRKAFIPAKGNVFFSADYSQIELRLVADVSGDATMLDAFKHNHDIHAITASKIYHCPLDQVTPDQRRKAKTANFGILYGISAFGLAQRLAIPRNEAKMLIDGYYQTFPSVREYIDHSIAQAREKGYVTTAYGRRRMLPDINSRNAVVRAFSERNAINAPIQGTAADVIKIAMVRIYHQFKQQGLRSQMILQVHDELCFDVHPDELEAVKTIVVREMEGAYQGQVALITSCGIADNWLDAH